MAGGLLTVMLAMVACGDSGGLGIDGRVARVRVDPGQVSVVPGETVRLTARAEDARGQAVQGATIEWASSAPAIATVAADGTVRGEARGTATISASALGRTGTAQVTVGDAPVPTQQARLYGLHMDLTFDGDAGRRVHSIRKAKEIGTRVSRNSFLWHMIEGDRGARDWSRTDAIVDELLGEGIEPLFFIYGSPPWANGVGRDTHEHYLYVPTGDAAFRWWVDEYKKFVAAAVARYRGRVKMWQLWNEQNGHFFWKPKPDLDRYIVWYSEIYRVIKEIDPSAQVALGGLTNLAAEYPGDYSGVDFLRGLYSRGVRPDIVAIHPYTSRNQAPDAHIAWENNFDDIALIRQTMVENGEGGKPIWVTEWGWSLARISEATQAEYVGKSLEMIRNLYPYVTLATYFIDYDKYGFPFGLYDSGFRLRPAGERFREIVR